jgi:spore coat polysaccharide biosynthesis protein SpsF
VYRGSHEDVLDRFSGAAHAADASAVVRLTADCPLIDPLVVDQLVEKFSASRKGGSPFDYVSNTIERTYPRGLDAEVFSLEALTAAAQNARKPYEREHVTPYLYGRPEEFSIGQVVTSRDAAHHRWTLDTSADYHFLRAVFHLLGPTWPTATWEEILEAVEAHPGLADINRHIVQKIFNG